MYDPGAYCRWSVQHEHVLLFFKQKTAYEVRISDWSSDVCSSDLEAPVPAAGQVFFQAALEQSELQQPFGEGAHRGLVAGFVGNAGTRLGQCRELGRASGREGWVRTCSSRGSPYP